MTSAQPTKDELIIWTPSFILIVVAILAGGLSGAALFTRLWLDGYIGSNIVLPLYVAPVIGSALLIMKRVHNGWLRVGSAFTCLWGLLLALHVLVPVVEQLDPHTTLVEHLDIAMALAYLGVSSCFSVATSQYRRFDSWFFALLPLVGVMIVIWRGIMTPVDLPTGGFDEGLIVTALFYLGIIIWWFRPANWREQPEVTLLSGMIPWLQLSFTSAGYDRNDVSLFMTQVLLLFFWLVHLRILQAEQCLFVKRVKIKSTFHTESK